MQMLQSQKLAEPSPWEFWKCRATSPVSGLLHLTNKQLLTNLNIRWICQQIQEDSNSPHSDSREVKLWQWALKSPGSQAGVAQTWYFQLLRTCDCHAVFKIIQKCNIKPFSNFLIWENRFQSHLKNRGQRESRQNFLRPDLHIELCNSLIAALPAAQEISAFYGAKSGHEIICIGVIAAHIQAQPFVLEDVQNCFWKHILFFFFFQTAISLFLAALWTKSRVVLVISMSQESGNSACFWMLPSIGEFSANCREWRSGLQLIFVGLSDTLHVHGDIQLVWLQQDTVVKKNWLEFFFWNNPLKCSSIKPLW